MHSPGVCGAILAIGSSVGGVPSMPAVGALGQRPVVPAQSRTDAVGALIDALNADTEMVLVAAAGDEADALAPAVWSRAAYLVRLAPEASQADGLRTLLQDVLNRGRDAILVTTLDVTTLDAPALTSKTVQRMVAEYRAASDEIWAVVPESSVSETRTPESGRQPGGARSGPMLLGRRMIELFLRGRQWRTAEELLATHREHVRALKFESQERSV